MRVATFFVIAALMSCRSQQAAVTTGNTDTLSFADVTPRDSADSSLITPRVITEPTVVVFLLEAEDTFSADVQAEAMDELKTTRERIQPRQPRRNIKEVPD